MLRIKYYERKHAQCFNFGNERNIMNKLSIVKGNGAIDDS